MQLTVIGSGAIGGTVAAYLLREGHDVLLCDADLAHVDAVNANGLRIEGPVDAFTVPARAVLPADLPDVVEHAIVAVKSQHTASAAALLRDRLAPDGYVLSLQNGLTSDVLAEAVGRDRVLVGFVNFGADRIAPGVVLQGNVAAFRVGELSGPVTPRLRELAAVLPWAQATDNIAGYLWSKEAYGALLFATAVSDLSIADALADRRFRPLMLALAREVLAQAPVPTESFDGFVPSDLEGSIDRLVTFNRASAKTHSGVYRDLAVLHRPTEVGDILDGLTGPLTGYVGALIRAIERGERGCEVANLELLAAYERLERLGRPLHAVVRALPAPARAATGPMHGVAVAVKDMIDVAGVPRGNGNPRAMADPPATDDAPVVRRLRQAGADVFATSSLLEYAAGAPHPDLPQARNPVDPGRTAGGSSGGSAALVAAGVCVAALGTDTGGSIRIPASYCGVVGIKPSHGAVPVTGVQALAPTLDHVGVIAQDVATTAHVLAVLCGAPLPGGPVAEPSRLRVGVLRSQVDDPRVQPDVRAAVLAAVDLLRRNGIEVHDRDATPLDALDACFTPIVLHEAWVNLRPIEEADPGRLGPDTARLVGAGAGVGDAAYRGALELRERLLPAADAVLLGVDVLLGPSVPFTAPASTPVLDSAEGEVEGLFSAFANVTGQPAVTLPCGTDRDGLPIGLQLAGHRGRDADLLAAAALVERLLA